MFKQIHNYTHNYNLHKYIFLDRFLWTCTNSNSFFMSVPVWATSIHPTLPIFPTTPITPLDTAKLLSWSKNLLPDTKSTVKSFRDELAQSWYSNVDVMLSSHATAFKWKNFLYRKLGNRMKTNFNLHLPLSKIYITANGDKVVVWIVRSVKEWLSKVDFSY